LYAEGHSVTRFLVGKKDCKTFLAFVTAGMKDGWDKAVKAHYGYKDVEALEDDWRRQVGKEEARDETERDSELPLGLTARPAPITALARLDRDGRIVVRHPLIAYEPRTVPLTHSGPGPAKVVTAYLSVVQMKEHIIDASEVTVFDRNGNSVE